MAKKHASPKQIIEIGAKLNDVFDVEAGRYRDNHSDVTIGEAVGASKNSVYTVRRSLGMEIRRRPPIAAAERELMVELEKRVTAAYRRLSSHDDKLELIAEHEKRIAVLEKMLARLDHVVNKMGEMIGKEKFTLIQASARIAFPNEEKTNGKDVCPPA